jgi:hypothetical protein
MKNFAAVGKDQPPWALCVSDNKIQDITLFAFTVYMNLDFTEHFRREEVFHEWGCLHYLSGIKPLHVRNDFIISMKINCDLFSFCVFVCIEMIFMLVAKLILFHIDQGGMIQSWFIMSLLLLNFHFHCIVAQKQNAWYILCPIMNKKQGNVFRCILVQGYLLNPWDCVWGGLLNYDDSRRNISPGNSAAHCHLTQSDFILSGSQNAAARRLQSCSRSWNIGSGTAETWILSSHPPPMKAYEPDIKAPGAPFFSTIVWVA